MLVGCCVVVEKWNFESHFSFITCCRNLEFESRIDWLLRCSCETKLRISFRFITCCRNLEFESCAGWLLRHSCEVELRISFWFYYVLS